MIRTLFVITVVFSTLAQAQPPGQSDHFIVTFQPGTPQNQRAAAVRRAGASVRFNYSIVDAVAIRGGSPNALAALGRDPSVLAIIPDREVHAIQRPTLVTRGKPSDGSGGTVPTGQVTPEGVKRVGLPTAGSDGDGVGVAIVDTGIDLGNADLRIGSSNFNASGGSCQDDNGHGTHVSGIVAAKNNTTGVLGVAPGATLYCVKVLNAQGSGSDGDVVAGLQFVLENANKVSPPIRVVNMS